MLRVVQKGAHVPLNFTYSRDCLCLDTHGAVPRTAQMAIIHPCALPGRSLSIILQNLMHYFSYFTALNTNLTTPSTDAYLDNDL